MIESKGVPVNPHLNRSTRSAVTVIEVLFAMFVVLFGLIGIATLLPMAGRQAGDSYSMTHGGAAMQNVKAEVATMETFHPTYERPWWFADDEYATTSRADPSGMPPTYLGFGDSADVTTRQARWYRSASSMKEIMDVVKQRFFNNRTGLIPTPPELFRIELSKRNGQAQGFCIDPQFCASELLESWPYPKDLMGNSTYQHDRQAANQGVFRRSRMPFFDEQTGLGTTGFATNTAYLFPRLMRVSFQGNTTGSRFTAPIPEPLPLSKENAAVMSSTGGDLLSQTAESDKTFGPLRYFSGNAASGFGSSPSSRRITWLATMTPSEQTAPGLEPKEYDLAVAVFNNRDPFFAAAPPAITGLEKFADGERMCFATSPTATSVALTTLGDLAFSHQGGAFEVQLWSDELTDPSIRIGDWVMLSRRIVLGNRYVTNDDVSTLRDLKVVHRHRWYRVIGVQDTKDGQTTAWPQTIRVFGEPWDYPEMNASMQPGFNYTTITSSTGVYGLDGISAVGPPPTMPTPPTAAHTAGKLTPGRVVLTDLATTVTIFKNVVAVYKRTITVE